MSTEYTYTDAKELSSGAFSSVFCAVQRNMEGNAMRVVALKRVNKISENDRKVLANDPHREKMFLGALCHENVVELLDFFESLPYGHSRKESRLIDNSDSDELQYTASLGPEESSEESSEEENRRELQRALSQVTLTDPQPSYHTTSINTLLNGRITGEVCSRISEKSSEKMTVQSSKLSGSRQLSEQFTGRNEKMSSDLQDSTYERDLTGEDLSISRLPTDTTDLYSTPKHKMPHMSVEGNSSSTSDNRSACRPLYKGSGGSSSDSSSDSDEAVEDRSPSIHSKFSHATSRSGMRSMKVYYIVMPYLPYNLHDLLYCNNVSFYLPQRIPIPIIKNICLQMARAVAYVHSRNVIHRDLKMLNFLLSSDGIVKLGDFGQSCHISETKLPNTGTRNYRAIELCLGRSDYDYAVDIYSLGLLFFELVCSRPLFSCSNDIEYVYQTNLVLGPISPFETVYSAPDFEKLVLTSDHSFQSGIKSLLSRYYPDIPDNFYSVSFLTATKGLYGPRDDTKTRQVGQKGTAVRGATSMAKAGVSIPLSPVKSMTVSESNAGDECPKPTSLFCDLLCKMLHPDARQRITAPDVLAHPWFQDGVGSTDLVAKFLTL